MGNATSGDIEQLSHDLCNAIDVNERCMREGVTGEMRACADIIARAQIIAALINMGSISIKGIDDDNIRASVDKVMNELVYEKKEEKAP